MAGSPRFIISGTVKRELQAIIYDFALRDGGFTDGRNCNEDERMFYEVMNVDQQL